MLSSRESYDRARIRHRLIRQKGFVLGTEGKTSWKREIYMNAEIKYLFVNTNILVYAHDIFAGEKRRLASSLLSVALSKMGFNPALNEK